MALNHLVKSIDDVLEKVSGEEKKELLCMIVEQIEITPSGKKRSHSRQRDREVANIKLYFDFTPDAVKKVKKPDPKDGKLCSNKNIDFSPLNKLNPSKKS